MKLQQTLTLLLAIISTYAAIKAEIGKTKQRPNESVQQKPIKHLVDGHKLNKPIDKSKFSKGRTVTIKSTITDDSFAYQHWSGTYRASDISVLANQQPVNPKQTIQHFTTDNMLCVEYKCKFANGTRKSAKTVTFELDPKASEYELSFSWKNPERLTLSNAKIVASR